MDRIYGIRVTNAELLDVINKYLETNIQIGMTADFDMDEEDIKCGCFLLCISNIESEDVAKGMLESFGPAGSDTLNTFSVDYDGNDGILHLSCSATLHLLELALKMKPRYIFPVGDQFCIIPTPEKQAYKRLSKDVRDILENSTERMAPGEQRMVTAEFEDGIEINVRVSARLNSPPDINAVLLHHGCAVATAPMSRHTILGAWSIEYMDTCYTVEIK